MPTLRSPASLPNQSQPPAKNYPTLDHLNLPRGLTQAVTRSFEVAYSVGDQATATQNNLAVTNNYGTWNERLSANPVAFPDGALWHHTDLHDVYQIRVDPKMNQRTWFYNSGVAWIAGGTTATTATGFTFTPTSGPAVNYALGPNDMGFQLLTGGSIHVWDGKAWTS
jgi:hypothetical protein